MGNKIKREINNILVEKKIGTEKLKEMFIQLTKHQDINEKINKATTIKFLENIFQIYELKNNVKKKKKKKIFFHSNTKKN